MNSNIRRRGIVAAASAIAVIAAMTGCAQGSSSSTTNSAAGAGLELITPGVLRVGTTPGSKPYIFQGSSGQWEGFENDLVTNVAKRAGIDKVEWVSQDFSSLLSAVANQQYDIAAACIGVTAERRKTVDYVKDYNNGYLIFVAKKGSGITKAADLAGKRVGTITSSVEETYLHDKVPDAQFVGFPDFNSATQALLSGSIDSAFMDTDPAGAAVKQYPQLAEAFKVVSTAPCAWPISYKKPKLKAALDKGMEAAIQDGTVEKLTKKWLPDSPILPEYKPKS